MVEYVESKQRYPITIGVSGKTVAAFGQVTSKGERKPVSFAELVAKIAMLGTLENGMIAFSYLRKYDGSQNIWKEDVEKGDAVEAAAKMCRQGEASACAVESEGSNLELDAYVGWPELRRAWIKVDPASWRFGQPKERRGKEGRDEGRRAGGGGFGGREATQQLSRGTDGDGVVCRAATAPRETRRGAGKRPAQRKGAAKTPEKRPAKKKVGQEWRCEREYIKKSYVQVKPGEPAGGTQTYMVGGAGVPAWKM